MQKSKKNIPEAKSLVKPLGLNDVSDVLDLCDESFGEGYLTRTLFTD